MTTMSSMSSKLKGTSVRRGQLKEKVVQMYEELLHPTLHPTLGNNPQQQQNGVSGRFWEDFFLLKVRMIS